MSTLASGTAQQEFIRIQGILWGGSFIYSVSSVIPQFMLELARFAVPSTLMVHRVGRNCSLTSAPRLVLHRSTLEEQMLLLLTVPSLGKRTRAMRFWQSSLLHLLLSSFTWSSGCSRWAQKWWEVEIALSVGWTASGTILVNVWVPYEELVLFFHSQWIQLWGPSLRLNEWPPLLSLADLSTCCLVDNCFSGQ